MTSAEEWTNQGSYFYSIENYSRALEVLNSALALDRNFAEAYLYRGLTYFRLKDYQFALADADRHVALCPPGALDLGGLGFRVLCYLRLGDYQRALLASNDLFQQHQDFYKRLKRASYKGSEREDALAPYHYLRRGIAYEELGKHEQALADFDRAEALCGTSYSRCSYSHAILYHRGNVYLAQREYEQALGDYERALEEFAENRPDGAPPEELDDDVDEAVLRSKRDDVLKKRI